MRNFVILVAALIILSARLNAQHIEMDIDRRLGGAMSDRAGITMDNKYTYFTAITSNLRELIISKTDRSFRLKIANGTNPYLSEDNRYLIYSIGKDSIGVFDFARKKVAFTESGTKLTAMNPETMFLFTWTQLSDKGLKNLVVWDCRNSRRRIYNNVLSVYYGKNQFVTIGKSGENKFDLHCLDTHTGQELGTWTGPSSPQNIRFSKNGDKIAFSIQDTKDGQKANSIIVLSANQSSQVYLISDKMLDSNFKISNRQLAFDEAGNRLFFSLVIPEDTINKNLPSVDVWNYKDHIIQSQQLSELKEVDQFTLGCFTFSSESISILNLSPTEHYLFDYRTPVVNIDDYYLTRICLQSPSDQQLNISTGFEMKGCVYLKSLSGNNAFPITSQGYFTHIQISPNGKYVLYFDQVLKHYFTYSIRTGETVNITNKIPVSICEGGTEEEKAPFAMPNGTGGWLSGDRSVVIYDDYDIWKVDPLGLNRPVCITNGYGRLNHVALRINTLSEGESILKEGQAMALKGVSKDDYREGYLLTKFNDHLKLRNFILEPFKTWTIYKKHNNYLSLRSSNNSPKNWYVSKDLRSYKLISEIQDSTVWFSKELLSFKNLDGNWNKGVLYKPKDFDSSKKYPVIFQFYEVQSDKIYEYERPALSPGHIDPAWFASIGYLVFQPDIKFTFGKPGPSALNCVLGAATFLSQKPWVDSLKMGLSGGSHGGYSVNYIVAHSNRFRAAASSSGVADLISSYGGTRETGFSRQYIHETGQGRIGATLWERPDLYLENSPIMSADKVSTPLLILHNKEDSAVPWAQGVEWFMALRRLGKKVWMLQYDGEDHGVFNKANQIDYTRRLEQFFGHYLRNEHIAIWMSKGIPARMKQHTTGLVIDPDEN